MNVGRSVQIDAVEQRAVVAPTGLPARSNTWNWTGHSSEVDAALPPGHDVAVIR